MKFSHHPCRNAYHTPKPNGTSSSRPNSIDRGCAKRQPQSQRHADQKNQQQIEGDLICAAKQKIPVQNIVDHVRVDLDARIVDPTEWRRAQIADSCRGRAHQHDFPFECSRGKFVADHVGDRNIGIGGNVAFIVDHHPPDGVGVDDERGAELQRRDARFAEVEHGLLVGQSLKKAHGLHVERAVKVPIVQILRPAVGKHQQGMPHDAVRVRLDIEKSGRAVPLAKRVAENFDVGLRAFRHQRIRVAEALDQMLQIALPGLRICRAHLREGEIGEDVGVAVQRFVIDALQIVFGIEKEIPEYDVSKPLDGPRKLFVAVIFF